jgi:hypothetical protein
MRDRNIKAISPPVFRWRDVGQVQNLPYISFGTEHSYRKLGIDHRFGNPGSSTTKKRRTRRGRENHQAVFSSFSSVRQGKPG